ncbi:Oidioi.mRNA.OKI2018_I69.PAR.g9599.t1.cds [Oikopleura dioica]|uniref:Oidioi.mRNA.OKI2018_I69.PAR.g9599.t1.cds n=1 Tax=Oikopleura dioica TaxID=34765 RepID=A0ABN7RQL5_OIKDI|nr:Oidioi.mRNA.OKI2018_I69.PAR.g9599.t1.cds [Oikopleura dioica]
MKLFKFLAVFALGSANLAEAEDNSVIVGVLQRVMEKGAHPDTAQQALDVVGGADEFLETLETTDNEILQHEIDVRGGLDAVKARLAELFSAPSSAIGNGVAALRTLFFAGLMMMLQN